MSFTGGWAARRCGRPRCPFRPEKYSGELYVHVPQAVDDGHACALKDLPRFRRCRPGDQQQRRVLRKMACVFDELPGGSRVGLPLRLQFYDIGDAAGPDDKSGPSVVGRSFSHAYLGDVAKDPQRLLPKCPLNIHYRVFIHSDCEYAINCEYTQEIK